MHIWRRHGWQALFMQQKHGTNPNILAFFRWYAVSITWFGVYNIGGNNTQMFPSYSYLWPVLYLRFIFKMFEQNDLGAFFFLEGSHVHCAYIRAFKKWIVVCQKEKDKRIPSWHITVLSTWCGTFAVGFLCQLVLVQSLSWSSGVAVKIIPRNQLLYSWRLSLLCLLCLWGI